MKCGEALPTLCPKKMKNTLLVFHFPVGERWNPFITFTIQTDPESDHRRGLPPICRPRAPLQIVRKNEDKTATAEDNGVNQRDRPTAAPAIRRHHRQLVELNCI